MNVVYIKHFENGKKYVGITNNFERRMDRHEKDARYGSTLPIHRAMRKYNHETEIVFESECYDDVLKYERIIIQNFKDLGDELYNLTDGGKGRLGLQHSEETKKKLREANLGEKNPMWGKHLSEETKQKLREALSGDKSYLYGKTIPNEIRKKISEANKGKLVGEKNPMYGKTHTDEVKQLLKEIQKGEKSFRAKPMEYYETNATRRDKFKRTCERMGWNYDNFEEVDSNEIYVSPNGTKAKKYFYIYRGECYKREVDWSKTNNRPKEYYEYTPTLRSSFKDYCERNNLNFDDFEEIFSGEYYYFKSGSKIGKYYYKYKESE